PPQPARPSTSAVITPTARSDVTSRRESPSGVRAAYVADVPESWTWSARASPDLTKAREGAVRRSAGEVRLKQRLLAGGVGRRPPPANGVVEHPPHPRREHLSDARISPGDGRRAAGDLQSDGCGRVDGVGAEAVPRPCSGGEGEIGPAAAADEVSQDAVVAGAPRRPRVVRERRLERDVVCGAEDG